MGIRPDVRGGIVMGKVLDFDAVRDSDPNEIVFTAAGPFEQMSQTKAVHEFPQFPRQNLWNLVAACLKDFGTASVRLVSLGIY